MEDLIDIYFRGLNIISGDIAADNTLYILCIMYIKSLTLPQEPATKPQVKDDANRAGLAKTYKKKVEDELTELCEAVLELLGSFLIPNASDNESKVSYSLKIVLCLLV